MFLKYKQMTRTFGIIFLNEGHFLKKMNKNIFASIKMQSVPHYMFFYMDLFTLYFCSKKWFQESPSIGKGGVSGGSARSCMFRVFSWPPCGHGHQGVETGTAKCQRSSLDGWASSHLDTSSFRHCWLLVISPSFPLSFPFKWDHRAWHAYKNLVWMCYVTAALTATDLFPSALT